MSHRPFVVLILLAIAACAPEEAAPSPSPSGGLGALLPSPTPDRHKYGSDPVPIGTFVYYEDFEKGFAAWDLAPKPAAGAVGLRPLKAPACGGLWTVHLGLPKQQPFVPAAGRFVLTKWAPLDLAKARKPWLKYDVKGLTAPVDALDLTAEVRPAGGAWRPIGRRIEGGYMFMASIGADLTPWAGQLLGLRFVATLRPGTEPTKGFYIDDVVVIEPKAL